MVNPNQVRQNADTRAQTSLLIEDLERTLQLADHLRLHLVAAHLNQALIEAQKAGDAA